ncbi:MAG: ABC transporter ATP-binding protein [Phycisphaerales bacterium]|nr:MAG: ABC transporter ATP-binding protein [Phycisphaerales bacterium]
MRAHRGQPARAVGGAVIGLDRLPPRLHTTRSMHMIVAENLVKVFPAPDGGSTRAVDGLSFRVGSGQIYGLLGPNGAGKTTTLRMLSGLMTPTSGRAVLAGHDVVDDPQAVKRMIGFLTADTGLYQRLPPRELLTFFAALHGLSGSDARRRVDHLIDWLEMGDFAELRCGGLSTGQRQRTSIARALVADPPILILDEPTLGLDVLSNRVILDFIVREREEGKTVLLSTHYLHEAEVMCDHVGLLHNGALVAEGTVPELLAATGEAHLNEAFLKVVGESETVLPAPEDTAERPPAGQSDVVPPSSRDR